MHKYEVRLACLLLLGIGVCVGVQAGDEVRDRATLRGLKGVEVLIEDLPPQMVEDGLPAKQIHTDVELRLRTAGIPVLSGKEALKARGSPYLYVRVSCVLSDEGLYSFSLEVELRQTVVLERNPSIAATGIPTWSVGLVGSIGRSNLRQIRANVADYVDQFTNAYLSVNRNPDSP